MSTTDETLTRYAVLIYQRESAGGVEDIPAEVMEANERFDAHIAEQGGRMVAGVALHPSATATSVRGGVVTDGPFMETKEGLAGLYILEARDLDHAIALARETPTWEGGVEIRPLIDFVVLEPG